jgi:hypothetical protein
LKYSYKFWNTVILRHLCTNDFNCKYQHILNNLPSKPTHTTSDTSLNSTNHGDSKTATTHGSTLVPVAAHKLSFCSYIIPQDQQTTSFYNFLNGTLIQLFQCLVSHKLCSWPESLHNSIIKINKQVSMLKGKKNYPRM